jgi:hypothetical protein
MFGSDDDKPKELKTEIVRGIFLIVATSITLVPYFIHEDYQIDIFKDKVKLNVKKYIETVKLTLDKDIFYIQCKTFINEITVKELMLT